MEEIGLTWERRRSTMVRSGGLSASSVWHDYQFRLDWCTALRKQAANCHDAGVGPNGQQLTPGHVPQGAPFSDAMGQAIRVLARYRVMEWRSARGRGVGANERGPRIPGPA
jgi:hypothetical protein